ncbi:MULTISPECIES: substrate-binding periplasmic protein [Leisingera]|jgi:polar amino acid transport system substrate-binding protein|uniref:substrate-binding periplasmic protein n=1 Tax=Leisingera TaxID=191028 RepID=UPI00115298D5|nr:MULTISPECIES: transporter substrate-binding domain-containing protein [Leisingera]QDI76014.1 transporter substrate-binding domain-containing protein [Leisingera aquaemixtae]
MKAIDPARYLKTGLGCVLAAFLFAAAARAETVLTFCYDPYPPYTLGTGSIPSGGLKVDLLDAVMERIGGLSAVTVLLPWQRCLAQAKSGEADGILPLYKSPEREAFLAFTEPAFQQTNTLWYNRGRFPDGLAWSAGYAGVSHLRLGMVNGSVIDPEMEAAFSARNRIVKSGDAAGLMQMLLFGQLDLIAIDDAVGRYHVGLNGWHDRIAAAGKPVSSRMSHFGLSRASGAAAYLEEFDRAIRELKAEGEIGRILHSRNYSH